MKGIVFTEFMEMVESRMGYDMLDQIIEEARLPTDGAYAASASYDHHQLLRMTQALSNATGIPAAELVRIFGEHLFQRLAATFPVLFAVQGGAFGFLQRVEAVTHAEVRKLYPDAELPRLQTRLAAPDRLEVLYSSPRGLADLAHGLIEGCAAYFREDIDLLRQDLPPEDGQQRCLFILTRR